MGRGGFLAGGGRYERVGGVSAQILRKRQAIEVSVLKEISTRIKPDYLMRIADAIRAENRCIEPAHHRTIVVLATIRMAAMATNSRSDKDNILEAFKLAQLSQFNETEVEVARPKKGNPEKDSNSQVGNQRVWYGPGIPETGPTSPPHPAFPRRPLRLKVPRAGTHRPCDPGGNPYTGRGPGRQAPHRKPRRGMKIHIEHLCLEPLEDGQEQEGKR